MYRQTFESRGTQNVNSAENLWPRLIPKKRMTSRYASGSVINGPFLTCLTRDDSLGLFRRYSAVGDSAWSVRKIGTTFGAPPNVMLSST